MVHELSRADARRVAVRAQRLTDPRPTDLHDAVRALSLVQLDPVSAIAPSADLVLWSRIGSSYDVQELKDAINELTVLELRGSLRVAEDIALYRADMEVWPGTGDVRQWRKSVAEWVKANDGCRLDILDRLRSDGPLPLKELPDTCARPWRSTGWNNNKNVPMLLDAMVARGEVAVAGRQGREKLWDLAERIYPDDEHPDIEESARLRDARRLGSLGIARSKGPECPIEPVDVRDAGEPAVVEGVKGEWRVDPAQLGQPFSGRAALLSPFDRLLHDRKRMSELFEFEYALEMYKPAATRRWGYYALPILYDDRLIGKLDAASDRDAGELRINAVHEDEPFSKKVRTAVETEIEDLAEWLQLDLVR
ncbi:MAG TPA: crosslink repair DNA glycosylase YcaQ family protein [Nocardioidaceae bacterium]|nr:crosslink repair DNA glycosylase YcaQ family protein [Nocardioidaceae bacterium]